METVNSEKSVVTYQR